jgi:integrase
MAKRLHRLSARTVATATKPGRHADGGNLYLAVTKAGAKRWTFLYEHQGKQREAGLGSVNAVSLAEARAKAAEYRSMLARGVDPLTAKSAPTALPVPTFGELANELFAAKRPGWRSEAHAQQWQSSVARYTEGIRDLSIDQIGIVEVLRVLQPLWQSIPETASRLRGRIETVLDFAKARGMRSGENPAAWKGNLSHLLPRRPRLAQAHFSAMPYTELPAFMAGLRAQDGIAPRALEFLILTATRRSEMLGTCWGEIDLDQEIWTLPPARTKTGVGYRVPLSERAYEILAQLAEKKSGAVIFHGHRPGHSISVWKVATLLPPGASIHGFRSSFRDFCAERTSYPRELCEEALGHSVGSPVERAYRRTDLLERRRELMQSWANFCDPAASNKCGLDHPKGINLSTLG